MQQMCVCNKDGAHLPFLQQKQGCWYGTHFFNQPSADDGDVGKIYSIQPEEKTWRNAAALANGSIKLSADKLWQSCSAKEQKRRCRNVVTRSVSQDTNHHQKPTFYPLQSQQQRQQNAVCQKAGNCGI
ncbi:hypothetical protein T03_13531 [Trichinella britovi]|uniref:Uncharacterized protein n=1 Tax=Trichinella britovi TaxID=45882 RepID=A0A0V1D1R4_TRIBR|nr:hypothetical protein T03_13531 [Trichinella britovi]